MFLLDANIFIEAHRRYYPKEIVPSFWQWLVEDERIFTLKKVKEEVEKGDDLLKESIKHIKVVKVGSSYAKEAKEISDYIQKQYGQESNRANIDTFLEGADFPLICAAKEKGWKLVTEEKSADSVKKVKIPNICSHFSIKYINTFEMLKQLNVTLGESYIINDTTPSSE